MKEKIDLPKLEGHHCFACGSENPKGLNLYFYRDHDKIYTDITLGRDYEGWENLVHGGILSTLLDETMSWTIIFFKRVFFVTRKMDVKYIRPVEIGKKLTVRGRISDDSAPPKIFAKADIVDENRNLLVRGTGEFITIPEQKLAMVPEGLRRDMNSLFESLPEP